MQRVSHWHIDTPILVVLLLLCAASLAILYSAGGEDLSLLYRQGLRILLAFIMMFVLAQVTPQTLMRWAPYVFVVGLILLMLVLLVGIVGKGAQRWLNLGLLRFQPAEIMKLGVPMMVAWLFTRQSLPPKWRDLLLALSVVLLPAFLVAVQPDLGTALLIAASGLLVIFLAGISWYWIVGAAASIAAAAPVLWTMLHEYQQRRILTLFDPWQDPLGSGYHTIQSVIAVGSGGVSGKGWGYGSQSQLEFIPERATDFIFAVFSEEFGLVGALILLVAYLFLIGRGIYIAFNAQDTFGRLLAGSLSLTFFFYLFVNIGMVSGILPVVGVPLPLISYGGTSMVTLMAGFGILMSIHANKKLVPQ